MERFRDGLIIGKFMPIHAGHQDLIETAKSCVDRLTVLVCTLKKEPVPGRLRYAWVRELYPDVNVVWMSEEVPSFPHEHPDFWNIWKRVILANAPRPDVLFTSEEYGDKLAEVLGCKHICVDLHRSKRRISGEMIRADPYAHWDLIPPPVRAYYVKRVCVVGAESTGKTTLTSALADEFRTTWVPEYAVEYLKNGNSDVKSLADIEAIARGQVATEDAKARLANRVLFCDTDLMTTAIWSDHFFGACPEWIARESYAKKYDMFLVTDIDIPWIENPWRDCHDKRDEFHNRFKRELELRDRKYVVISGRSLEDRLSEAIDHVRGLFPGGLTWLDERD